MPLKKEPANTMMEPEEPPSPLSANSKGKIFKQLQKLQKRSPDKFNEALVNAALSMCKFPRVFEKQLGSLQSAYENCQTIVLVKESLEKAIKDYLNIEGIQQFQELLKEAFDEKDWNSKFLLFLVKALELKFEEGQVVEATIQKGKIYWRILQNGKVLYNRYEDFNFANTNPWRMSGEQFRQFKGSGKRSGTVAITGKRFIAYFEQKYKPQAAAIWKELKQKGILNDKDRLSDGWRAISNDSIELSSVEPEPGEVIILRKDVLKCLRKLGADKGKIISRNEFIEWWNDIYQYRAGLIWDELKRTKVFNDENKLEKDLKDIKIKEFLTGLCLNYKNIAKAIREIVCNKDYEKNPKDINRPKWVIYRPERTLKTWSKTGYIKNGYPKDNNYCTKLWDVGTYDDLRLHRNTGTNLEYDHIPSDCILKEKSKLVLLDNENSIKRLKDEIEEIDKKLQDEREKLLDEKGIPYLTRGKQEEIENEKIQTLEEQVNKKNGNIEELKIESAQITAEKDPNKHGNLWWTIAIPKKLHGQGVTFRQNSSEQLASDEHPFLKDVREYLEILDKRPEDFLLTIDDYIKALGAFRYLYRCQVRESVPVNKKYRTGIAPQSFFKNAKETTDEIDKLFSEKMKDFIEKREGIKQRREKDKHSDVKKKLIYK